MEIDGSRRTVKAADGTVMKLKVSADPRWGMSAPVPQKVEVSSPNGRRSTISEARRVERSSKPGAPGAIRRVLTVDGADWTIASDPAARSTTITAPDGTTRTTTLDESGRPASRAVTGAAPVAYHYDDAGRVDAITVGTGTEARVWRRAYNGATGEVTTTDPAGRTSVVHSDADGRTESRETPGKLTIGARRDEVGRLTAVVAPSGADTRAQRRPDGRIDTLTAPDGAGGPQFTTFDYEDDGGLTATAEADGNGTKVHRDDRGRVDQVDAGAGPWHIGYDGRTGMVAKFAGPGATLERKFDGGDIVGETWSGPVGTSVTRRLDQNGRLVGEAVGGTGEVAFGYDEAGRLTKGGDVQVRRDRATGRVESEELGSLKRTWAYNAFGEVTAVAVTAQGRAAYELSVERDQLGRVSSRTERMPGRPEHTRTFTYDAAGRLASTADDGARPTTFGYDANGNLTTETAPDGTETKSTYDNRDTLLERGDTAYSYDAAGRLATAKSPAGTTGYTYDHAGALLAVRPPSGPTIKYVNDGLGRRMAKKVGDKTVQAFAYRDELRPAAELDAGGHVIGRFVYGSDGSAPTYVVRGGKKLLVVTDDLGTPRLLVDSTNGRIVERLDTDAWGRTTADTAPGTTPFGWAGGLADPDTGLVRFGARDYDPAARRWTATDPIGFAGGDTNLYRYVGGDPVNRVDRSGLLCDVLAFGPNLGFHLGPIQGSVAGGVVTGGTSFGLFGTYGGGLGGPFAGSGVGFTLDLTCLEELPDKPGTSSSGNPLDKFEGPGATVGGSAGNGKYGGSAGLDTSLNPDGSPSLAGGHVGFGPAGGAGGGAQGTTTGVWCIFGCPPEPVDRSAPERDPEGDAPPLKNLCDGGADCTPDDPSQPNDTDEPGRDQATGASSYGDPHLRTVGGHAFDLQMVGEFTALRSDSGDLVVQVRQVPLGGPPSRGGSRRVAINAAVAVGVNGDRLTFQIAKHSLEVRLNGKAINAAGALKLPKGGTLDFDSSRFVVTWPDHTVLRVFRGPVDFALQLADDRVGKVHGLLGPDTGKPMRGLETKDGKLLSEKQMNDHKAVYGTFGDGWRISQKESLFDYAPGESTATFTDRTFPDATESPSPASQRAAKRVCTRAGLVGAALANCILDVSVSGDASWAASNAAALRSPGPAVAPAGPAGPGGAGGAGGGSTRRMSVGDTVSGSLSSTAAKDTYTFTGRAGQIVYVEHQVGDCDISIDVLDASASRIGAGSACGDIGPVKLEAAGRYRIRVVRNRASTGKYRFHLKAVAATTNGAITIGDTVSGTLANTAAKNDHTFSARRGQILYVEHQVGDCDISVDVLDPTGSRVGAGSACGDIGPVKLEAAGQYRIRLTRNRASSGKYRFHLIDVPATTTKRITLGDTISGKLETKGAADDYTFTIAAGQIVYSEHQAGDCDISVDILDPAGSRVGIGSACGDVGPVKLEAGGQYRIHVARHAGSGDNYRFHLIDVPATTTKAIADGDTISGKLETKGAADDYTFNADRDQTATIEHKVGDCDISVDILDPAGSRVGIGSACGDVGPVKLEAGGQYRIHVARHTGSDADYRFRLRIA